MWDGVGFGVLICGLAIVVELIVWTRRRRRTVDAKEGAYFPPGPYAWPLIGHLYLLRNRPHQALQQLSTRYGHILGLRFGQQPAVVISSPDLAKQVLLVHDKVFADRPPHLFNSLLFFGNESAIVFSRYGPQWRKLRKICTLQLFTSKRMQELHHLRHQEMHALLLSLHRHSLLSPSTPVDIGKSVGDMFSRLLLRLLHSRPTAHVGDESLQQLIREVEQVVSPIMEDFIPRLSFLDYFKKQRMRCVHDRLDKMYAEMLKERRESTSTYDDLLQALLSHEEALTQQEIYGVLHDIVGAGIHTSSLTLEWAMAEILRNPHCLHQLRAEMEAHLGVKEHLSEADLPNLTYLKCIIKETFRLHPVVPMLVPRMSMEECKVQGYTIPAQTLVFVNVWAIGRDEGVWPKANEFLPERFKGKDTDLKGQHFELLPFGSGRRVCLGLPLALTMVEGTLANLVNCFDWEIPHGETCTSINMDEKSGFTTNKAVPVMAIPKPRVSFSYT